VGILASILPGVRDFRTPFTVGVLWMMTLSIALYKVYSGNVPKYYAVEAFSAVMNSLPSGASLAILGGATYIVGSIAQGISRRYDESELLRRSRQVVSQKLTSGRAAGWRSRFVAYLEIPDAESRRLVTSSVNDRLASLPPPVRGIVAEMIINEFHLTAHALNSAKPEHYQHYDRLRSEYELRNGIWPPLLGLAIVCSLLMPWPERIVTLFLGIFVAVVLILQAYDRRHESDIYLAQSIYSGWAMPPLFASLISAMSRDRIDDYDQVGRIAWLLDFFDSREMGGRLGKTVSKLRHPSWHGRLSDEDRARVMEAVDRYTEPPEMG
jgi:hypothetical protein